MWRLAMVSVFVVGVLLAAFDSRVEAQDDSGDGRTFDEKIAGYDFVGAMRSFDYLSGYHNAHIRLWNKLLSSSNLDEFDPGTNANPTVPLKNNARLLPDDAIVELRLTKKEIVELQLASWEELNIGRPNHERWMLIFMNLQEMRIADLELELERVKTNPSEERIEEVSERRDAHRKFVEERIDYYVD